jgi:hypothetical protein
MNVSPLLLVILSMLLVVSVSFSAFLLFSSRKGKAAVEREEQYARIFIGEAENPLLHIELLDTQAIESSRLKDIPTDDQKLANLQKTIKGLRSLIRVGRGVQGKSNSYVLKMSPEAARRFSEGSLEMMKSVDGGYRGILVDSKGKQIVEHVSFGAKGVGNVAVMATVFQILAVATAQYYLPQINRRLSKIEDGVNDLREHLEANDRAVLVNAVRHLRTMSAALEGRELDQADFRTELIGFDGIDQDCGRILEAYRDHAHRYRKELSQIDPYGTLRPDFESLVNKSEQFERAALTSIQAAYVRTLVTRFRCILPTNYRAAYAKDSLRQLSEDLHQMREEHEGFCTLLERRIKEAESLFDFDKMKELSGDPNTLKAERARYVKAEKERHQAVMDVRDELDGIVKDVLEQTERQLAAGSKPLMLVVTLNEDDEIASLAELTA